MLRRLIATAAVSTNLILSVCSTGAVAVSPGFKTEIPRAAAENRMTGNVSVTSQPGVPQLHGSLSQFEKFGLFCESNGKSEQELAQTLRLILKGFRPATV